MYLGGRKALLVLVPLLLLIGLATYRLGLYLWGISQHRTALEALRAWDFPQAQLHLNKALAVWPDDPTLLMLAARTARRQGNFTEAIQQLRLAQRSNAPKAELALERRVLRLQEGDLSEADTLLAVCAEHREDPQTPLILEALILGCLKVVNQQFVREMASQGQEECVDISQAQQAVDLWCRQRSGQAEQVQGLVCRGMLRSLARDYPKARLHFREALQRAPDHFQARLYLAELLAQESPEEAAGHFQILSLRAPENHHVQFRLAALRHGLGQLEESRQILDGLLAAGPDNVEYLVERGKVALDDRRFAQAEQDLSRAVLLAPNAPDVNLAFSSCLRMTGRMEEANKYQARFLQVEAERKRQEDELARKRKPVAKE